MSDLFLRAFVFTTNARIYIPRTIGRKRCLTSPRGCSPIVPPEPARHLSLLPRRPRCSILLLVFDEVRHTILHIGKESVFAARVEKQILPNVSIGVIGVR